jgi:hypothetical protein
MTSKNDITGDLLKSKPSTKKYEDNFDKIFGKKNIQAGKDEALLNAQECKKSGVARPQSSPHQPLDNGETWDEKRIDIIGSNGNTGEHY